MSKRLKITFINLNMGASEFAIAQKVETKLKEIFPDKEIEVASQFYMGKSLRNEIEKDKNKKLPNKRFSATKLRDERTHLIELQNTWLDNGKQDYAHFKGILSNYIKRKLNALSYYYQPSHNPDLKLLNAYHVKGPSEGMPYYFLNDIIKNVYSPNMNENEDAIEIKILMAQTTACGKYSKMTIRQKDKIEKLNETHEQIELDYFSDFQNALAYFKPNIVICENVPTLPLEFTSRLQKEISSHHYQYKSTTISHALVTATQRKRRYDIGCDFEFEESDLTLPHKERAPFKYLYSQNKDYEKKYTPILQEENIRNILGELRDKAPDSEKSHLYVHDLKKFIQLLKIFIALKNKYAELSDKKILLLPSKVESVFSRKAHKKDKNGTTCQKRQCKELRDGLEVIFNTKGKIKLYHSNNTPYQKIVFVHSHLPTPTLIGTMNYAFWDLEGYAPSVGETSLIQGMPKTYTQQVVSMKNDVRKTRAIATLAHNLSPKVVGHLIINLISRKLEQSFSTPKDELNLQSKSEIQSFLSNELIKGISFENYTVTRVQLKDKTHHVYFLADKTGAIIDDGIILSDLSLQQLKEEELLDNNGKLCIDNKSSRLEKDFNTWQAVRYPEDNKENYTPEELNMSQAYVPLQQAIKDKQLIIKENEQELPWQLTASNFIREQAPMR